MKNEDLVEGVRVSVKIEKITPGGGRGLARYEGLVIFVPFSAPLDQLEVEIVKRHKSYAEAKIISIEKESPIRIKPHCPYFEKCGGCNLQMMSVEAQEKSKQSFLIDMATALKVEKGRVLPLEGSPKSLRYRNRIQLHQKGKEVGYHQKKSNKIINIEDCLIADESLTKKIEELKKENSTQRLELALNTENQVVVRKKGSKNPKDLFFSQVNEGVNQKIIQSLTEKFKGLNPKPTSILDLYAGSGNLSNTLSETLGSFQVVAVELSSEAVKKGKKLQSKTKFECASVSDFLVANTHKFDLVIIDPPREGLKGVDFKQIFKTQAQNIFYLSCNISTLSRDLENFSEDYEVKSLQGFDMFPQTDHLEVLAHLVKKK